MKDWLEKNGVSVPTGIQALGAGGSKPAMPETKPDGSEDPAALLGNRRVVIVAGKVPPAANK